MFEYLNGQLTKITAKYLVLDVQGIGYILHVANPYRFSHQLNQTCQFYTHQVIREDAHLLYGFATEKEKQVFLHLISVSGIGPTTALAIIAADDNAGLLAAIEQQNITYLTKFPKIGKKTAQQMILDLEGKLEIDTSVNLSSTTVNSLVNPQLEEALEALEALGYKTKELQKVQKHLEDHQETTENYIKQALKLLIR